jgi:catechol 2,3-dioxygenase-like lactoylglutathione lyase family enzyme
LHGIANTYSALFVDGESAQEPKKLESEPAVTKDTFCVQQIDHVELFVPDQYQAAQWYERVLGLTILPQYEHWADGGPLMISSDEGGTMLALFKGEPPGSRDIVGHRRVAFRVDGPGFMRFLEHVKDFPVFDREGRRISDEHVVDHDQSWSIYFCDPYGNRYEVTTYDYAYVARRFLA